ncbi:polysaccharide biosynthesis tyrosine autokinase [Roseinatronobacter sp. S2]|uniref:GumC family protein n=1 Tax=Roseinatronobacter sp. S2 TaxID=3035471 RepID=UPI002410A753|nr:polysaccharide biosynthesis tyrosine autokinase [Roseinatronobacter sp. S2]WFE76940.1 polysaccharide biosynthesis tyrosine autokinase [Roseinatronobacter sp. S2]
MESPDIDLKEIIGILRRQVRLIALSFVVVLVPVIIYLALATPMYRATALIAIDAGESNLLDPREAQSSQSAILNSRVDGEVEVLRADSTILAVVEKGDLVRDPEFGASLGLREKIAIALGLEGATDRLRRAVGLRTAPPRSGEALVRSTIGKMRSSVEVRRRGLTYLISVGVTSADPQRAADLANLYVDTYIERQVINKTDSIMAARDVLQRQTENARLNLTRIEDSLNSFIDDNLARLEAYSNDPSVSRIRRELESAQSSRTTNLAALEASEDAAARSDWMTVAATLEDTAIEQLARERESLLNRLSGETAGSQAEVDLRAALDSIEQNLTQSLAEVQDTVETQLASIAQNEAEAREQLRDALLRTDMSSEVISDLFNLQQNATIAREQYQRLLSRVQDLNALANVQISDARVVSEALPPTSAASPNKRLIISATLVIAIGLGIGIALLNEYYIGGITSLAQLGNLSAARAVGAIPDTSPNGDVQLLGNQILDAPLSQYAESFRKLRLALDTNLNQSRAERMQGGEVKTPGTVILVSSALPGEGKSTSAIALARTYAASGKRTLLIDCDLRKPSIAHYLDANQEHGLIDYLDPDSTHKQLEPFADVLKNLIIVPAGHRSTKPTDQLINSELFLTMISTVREEFDIVILDSPPVLPVVDSRYLAQVADIIVMIVRFANTTQSEFREAATQLAEVAQPGVRLLGALNRNAGNTSRRYYESGYAGYYGEEKA